MTSPIGTGVVRRHYSASRTPSRLGREPAPQLERTTICAPLDFDRHVADVVDFHSTLAIGSSTFAAAAAHVIACTPILAGRLGLSVQVLLQQTWEWQGQRIGSPQLTISLAPCEKRTLELSVIRRRLRTDLRRYTTETTLQRETSDSSRSSTNVSQESARRRNWSFATNGSIGMSFLVDLEAGHEITLQQAIDETATLAAESLQEETAKSSEQLRSLEEITLESTEEDTVQQKETRVLKNPYHDRSLTLNVFSVNDVYSVLNVTRGIKPAVWVALDRLQLDREFVLANAAFLEATLLDRALSLELANAAALARRRQYRRGRPHHATRRRGCVPDPARR